ncbi:helix-turn-helix domain-containing protein [Adhaeribacter radiodurans]|uniref:AraC family transcriptional regulator n=1 Tax=Adhaeribacter radiodurans TaxID=2745197 RepID=A0A7L7L1K4_9BACT|nr:helix-turn-helix domain-containing protein [Adhaeribacter radiodurans]QMU26668.1 AraC family transcriptional regulator [Adhaeribacter radiodurans]
MWVQGNRPGFNSGRIVVVTLDEVAFTLGYEHGHHFSVAFKKYFGVSPSQHLRRKF